MDDYTIIEEKKINILKKTTNIRICTSLLWVDKQYNCSENATNTFLVTQMIPLVR